MTGQAAYGRAHGALVRLLPDVPDSSDRATEVLATLGRLGWRWVPQHATEPVHGPGVPPPAEWADAREQVRAAAARAAEEAGS